MMSMSDIKAAGAVVTQLIFAEQAAMDAHRACPAWRLFKKRRLFSEYLQAVVNRQEAEKCRNDLMGYL